MASEKVESTTRNYRLIKSLLFILLLISILVSVTPLAIEWAAVDWLKKNGVADADMEDIELNLFTGEASLSQLSVGQSEGGRFTVEKLYLQLDYLPLFERRIEVKTVQLNGMELDLKIDEDDQITLGALTLPKSEAEPAAAESEPKNRSPEWHFGLDQLLVNKIQLHTNLPSHQGNIKLNHLQIEQVASWLQDQYSTIEIDMLVDGAKVAIKTKVTPFKREPEWQGDLRIERVNFENYAALIKLAGIEEMAGQLTADLHLEGKWLAEQRLSLLFDGDLDLINLKLNLPELQLQQSAIKWQGKGEVHYPASTDQPLITLQSKLSLDELSLELPQQKLLLNQQSLRWDGELNYQEDREVVADGLRINGDLALESLVVVDQRAELKLASLQQANLNGFTMDGLQQIHAEQLVLKTLVGLGNQKLTDKSEPQQLFAADDVTVAGIAFQQLNNLTLNQVDLHGMKVALLRNREGRLKWLTSEENRSSEVPSEASPSESEPQFSFKLNQLTIAEDSSIQFQDKAVEPVYETLASPFELTVEGLDMGQPDQATTLMVKAKLDQYSSLDINGTLHPFQQPLSTDLKAQLQGIDLTSLSPYVVGTIGYDFRRGRLDSESSIKIDHGKLDINNELQIAKLTIIEADPETAAEFSESLVMPLDSALGILRDSDDNIAFNLPITGDLSAPEFSLSGVVNLALTNALKSAAMSYITNALQPLGAVLIVYDLLEKATQVRFKPFEYTPGSSELGDTNSEYADKVATLLQDRQALKLTLCGVSNGDDQALIRSRVIAESQALAAKKGKKITLDEATKRLDGKVVKGVLLEIAEKRSNGLKSYLMDKGVAETRLFTCRPMIDLEEEAKARVELTL
jgi:hypothetical protein